MKKLIAGLFLLTHLNFVLKPETEIRDRLIENLQPEAENIFIITVDGFRWQEVFSGADSVLINDSRYTQDTELTKLYYWDSNEEERRKKLMPFFWNVIAKKGQLLGNRAYGSKVNVKNMYGFSYPGYNELFTGTTDWLVNSNKKRINRNKNILELLNEQERFKGKVAAVTSWDVFPYILNEKRNKLPLNSGYENIDEPGMTGTQLMTNMVQQTAIVEKEDTRYDLLTFVTAKEYIKKHQPKVMYISLGETDEWAHHGRYDLYLQQANQLDKCIADLWYYTQTNEFYKNKTAFIITTDHGRGYIQANSWTKHGPFTPGSKEIWMAMIGPGIEMKGEVKEEGELMQKNISKLINRLLRVDSVDENRKEPMASVTITRKIIK
jgi:Type I phosphodiesterase / nucleotide pyrophosphatase